MGVLFLAGLYISSISSCMGGLYGSPRVLQCIANENVVPIVQFLGRGVSLFYVILYTLLLQRKELVLSSIFFSELLR